MENNSSRFSKLYVWLVLLMNEIIPSVCMLFSALDTLKCSAKVFFVNFRLITSLFYLFHTFKPSMYITIVGRILRVKKRPQISAATNVIYEIGSDVIKT